MKGRSEAFKFGVTKTKKDVSAFELVMINNHDTDSLQKNLKLPPFCFKDKNNNHSC